MRRRARVIGLGTWACLILTALLDDGARMLDLDWLLAIVAATTSIPATCAFVATRVATTREHA